MFGKATKLNWSETKKWLQCDWPIGEAAAMAVFLEASALKAGNVSPAISFTDMDHADFLVSGLVLRAVFDQADQLSVGDLVLQSITKMTEQLSINTTLGTVLLLAPLAKAVSVQRKRTSESATRPSLTTCIDEVLAQLTSADTQAVYAAIRLAKPGGLGRATEHDVHAEPPGSLIEAMRPAAAIDAVARQYVTGFTDVCDRLVVWLTRGLARGGNLSDLICEIQLRWMAEELDGLIIRKAGEEVAKEAQQLAGWARDEWLETAERGVRWRALDTFLRSGDRTRNPGTTADLIAAALFVLLTTRYTP